MFERKLIVTVITVFFKVFLTIRNQKASTICELGNIAVYWMQLTGFCLITKKGTEPADMMYVSQKIDSIEGKTEYVQCYCKVWSIKCFVYYYTPEDSLKFQDQDIMPRGSSK